MSFWQISQRHQVILLYMRACCNMESNMLKNTSICLYCEKSFSCNSTRNRHVKLIHNIQPRDNLKTIVICPLCSDGRKQSFRSYDLLMQHLSCTHNIHMKKVSLTFSNEGEFKQWMTINKKEEKYELYHICKSENSTYRYYYSNRSSTTGHQICEQRTVNFGENIKINGVWPSRVTAQSFQDQVQVEFYETHVGNSTELKSEQQEIVDKLQAGVPNQQIDAQDTKNNSLEGINLLNRDTIKYLSTKFNVEKGTHSDAMIAMKMNGRSSTSKNYAFLYKNVGTQEGTAYNISELDGTMHRKMEEDQIIQDLKLLSNEDFYKKIPLIKEILKSSDITTCRKKRLDKQSYYTVNKKRKK